MGLLKPVTSAWLSRRIICFISWTDLADSRKDQNYF